VLAVLLAIPAAVLGYGYWFARTHGSFYCSLSDSTDPRNPRPVDDASLAFLDARGEVLARAVSMPPYGTVHLSSPAAFSCREIEGRAASSTDVRAEWQRCFERQSRWIPTWIERVRAVDLRAGACTIRGLPVRVTKHGGEWWIWWVPLPHVLGKPYTLYSFSIAFDRTRCEPGR
jgi:hypothetical protein